MEHHMHYRVYDHSIHTKTSTVHKRSKSTISSYIKHSIQAVVAENTEAFRAVVAKGTVKPLGPVPSAPRSAS
jgi:hypothetical protein